MISCIEKSLFLYRKKPQSRFAARRTREHATPRDTQHVLKQHVKQHAPDGVPPSGNAKDALDTVASLRDDLQVRVSPG